MKETNPDTARLLIFQRNFHLKASGVFLRTVRKEYLELDRSTKGRFKEMLNTRVRRFFQLRLRRMIFAEHS